MRRLKFKDFYPANDEEVINTIKTYLKSDKKIIASNYTRNNFSIIKKQWPLFWSYVKNKSFTILDNKIVNFFEFDDMFLLINRSKIL